MIISLFPTFNAEISTSGTNFNFHALRIKGLWWSLENGIFPHHINDMANNFRGDADPIGYPYLFLYIPAYFLKFLPYTYCYNIYIIVINIATFILMYLSSFYIFKDKKVSIISSIAFILFYYRLHDIYDFCRMGEYTGLMFYPLAISGLYNIFFEDKKKWWFLSLAICGALGSHIITFFYLTLMVVALSIIFYIMSLIIKREPIRILSFIKAGILSILFSLWYIVPFLEYFFEKSLNFSTMGTSELSSSPITFSMPWEFFATNYDMMNEEMMGEEAANITPFFKVPANMSFGDYVSSKLLIVFIILIIVFLIYRCIRTKDIKKVIKEDFDNNLLYIILAILFFLIYLYYYKASKVEWHFQKGGLQILKDIYNKQQFSFRELGRGGVFLSLSIGYIFKKVFDLIFSVFSIPNRFKLFRNISIYLVLTIMVLSTVTYIKAKLDGRGKHDDILNASLSDYQFAAPSTEYVDEFMEDDIEAGDYVETVELSGDYIEYDTNKYHIDNYRRGYLSINFDYNYVSTPSDVKSEEIILPKNAYTGYNFYIDDTKKDFIRHSDGKPYVTITGDKGHVLFKFENNIRWTIAFLISISTLLICIIKRFYKEIQSIILYMKENRSEKDE